MRKFAEAQLKNYGNDFEIELSKGLYAGQKLVPVNTAGCYIPGGRFAHIASAVMSVTTAKVAGVKNIIACSPPKPNVGAHPTIIYTANLCGADVIMNLGYYFEEDNPNFDYGKWCDACTPDEEEA